MADNTGLFGDGMMGGRYSESPIGDILRQYRKPLTHAAIMENVDPYQQFLRRPENSVLPDWMSNSSSNSVMGKLDPSDPYGIEQARNANPTANEEAGLEMPMLADPYNYVGMGLGTGAANAVGKFVAPKANEMLENYMVKSGMQLPVFAGVRAKNAPRAAYNIASKMKEAGVADREIHAQTGWTFGFPDGRGRFEIDDSAAKGHFTHLPPSTDRLAEQAISHPSIYQSYPDLSEISQLGLKEAKEAGSFSPTYIDDAYSGGSLLAKAPDETGIKSVGLHELQHAIQQREGFASGGSPDSAANEYAQLTIKPKLDGINAQILNLGKVRSSLGGAEYAANVARHQELVGVRDSLEDELRSLSDNQAPKNSLYRRLAGEAEARLTQARMNMTQAERAASYPPSMFDVPVDQQIVRFGDGPAMSTNTNNQPLVNALRKPTAGELAQKLAHDRAMLPVSEHGLGLPAGNTAMDRAKAMEFNTPTYHGTGGDFSEFDPNRTKIVQGSFSTTDPTEASSYAEGILAKQQSRNTDIGSANVMPLLLNTTEYRTMKPYGWNLNNIESARDAGMKGAISQSPAGVLDTHLSFDPSTIRSRFAAFDPWRRNAAIAALTGTAAPDLMAGENDNLVNALRSK